MLDLLVIGIAIISVVTLAVVIMILESKDKR
jgi:hypothetical protein